LKEGFGGRGLIRGAGAASPQPAHFDSHCFCSVSSESR